LIDPVKRDELARACTRGAGVKIKADLLNGGHHGVLRIAAQGADGPAVITIPLNTTEQLFVPYAVDLS